MSSLDSLRQAAMVVASLDRGAADAVLDRLPTHQAAAIRQAMISLPDDEHEQQEAIRSFLEPPPGSQDLDSRSNIPEQPGHGATTDEPACAAAALAYVDPTVVASCLYHERASTISALLPSLPGKQAAAVLESMEPQKRTRILNNLGQRQQSYAPAVQAAATQLLELCQQPNHVPAANHATQQESLRELLNSLDDQKQSELLAGLAESNPLLARRLQRCSEF